MKLTHRSRFFATAAVALGALGAATAAQARSDVVLSIGVQPQAYYSQPAQVYVQPNTYYSQPNSYYVESRPVVQYGYDGYNRDWRRHDRRWERQYGPNGDLDHDGVRNQYDRDRDGDGVPNRFDRAPDNSHRR